VGCTVYRFPDHTFQWILFSWIFIGDLPFRAKMVTGTGSQKDHSFLGTYDLFRDHHDNFRISFKFSEIEFMKIENHPFSTLDWSTVPVEEYPGDTGKATWRVKHINDIRVRMVEYSPGYSANHWCKKGHVLLCLDGEMETELEDGRKYRLVKGMCYFVADEAEAHRSSTEHGCSLFIVD
jgi:hypothetical protein